MLVTFHGKGYPTITLFGDVAAHLLQLMGHSGIVPGALLAEEVPQALALLRHAVNHHQETPPDKYTTETVALRNRALPLIALLDDAVKQNQTVMWAIY